MRKPLDPRHGETQSALRLIGPSVALAGLIFTVVGIGNFFASFGSFEPPRYFWCAFVGLPLLGIGIAITKFAYLGAISRYMAGEVAPVGKDVVNYMAHETRDGVRETVTAVAEGLGLRPAQDRVIRCPRCQKENEAEANFCKACGTPLSQAKPCAACGQQNEADARFCNHCGRELVA